MDSIRGREHGCAILLDEQVEQHPVSVTRVGPPVDTAHYQKGSKAAPDLNGSQAAFACCMRFAAYLCVGSMQLNPKPKVLL